MRQVGSIERDGEREWLLTREMSLFGGHVCRVGSIQREGERERLLTRGMSHLFSSVIGACSRQGAGTGVILVLGCTIPWWQNLSVEGTTEK